jgi:hypothetical protein
MPEIKRALEKNDKLACEKARFLKRASVFIACFGPVKPTTR